MNVRNTPLHWLFADIHIKNKETQIYADSRKYFYSLIRENLRESAFPIIITYPKQIYAFFVHRQTANRTNIGNMRKKHMQTFD